MSSQGSSKAEIYNNYVKNLADYSKCMFPVLNAVIERNEDAFKSEHKINLENYCVYEKNLVKKYRALLNNDLAN